VLFLALIGFRLSVMAGESGDNRRGAAVECAVVPEYLFNTVLGRPGRDSVTARVLAWKDMDVFVSYGEQPNALTRQTEPQKLPAGEPADFFLDRLKPDTNYFYEVISRAVDGKTTRDGVHSFRTQRMPASSFTFAVQACSHLDVGTDARVYQQTLANMLAGKPDFMIDLGDTSMVDKFGKTYPRAISQYLAQRYYLGQIAHSVPLFLALGNHDGEQGWRLNGRPDSMPVWAARMRKKYFPNPEPGGIYTGNAKSEENVGLLEDYYAWEWGSALFIVLDPFWPSRERNGADNWNMTLGDEQYRWLTQTLKNSKAPFKFVFIHHLVGGVGPDSRGGIAGAPYLEWGGKNLDGSNGFAQRRPGWELPLHQLFVKYGVSIVFHGHDHLFVKEDLDGIVYQEVPQPSHPDAGINSGQEYGYKGTVLGNSGYLRVAVAPAKVSVEYVLTGVAGVTKHVPANGVVAYRYSISPRRDDANAFFRTQTQ